jgi:hypothetical protein
MAADLFEAEDFSNLTHWQSLAWHGAPRNQWRNTMPSVDDCSRTAPPPAPSGVAGMRRNQWLASVGITGWNASESPAGLRRNTQVAEAIERFGTPEIFNTHQGSQFTSPRFVSVLQEAGVRVSMDARVDGWTMCSSGGYGGL